MSAQILAQLLEPKPDWGLTHFTADQIVLARKYEDYLHRKARRRARMARKRRRGWA